VGRRAALASGRMDRAPKPSVLDRLREAVSLALTGDWQAAHEIVDKHEEEENARWIHAVVHRMEGDLDNARYWYGRCRRTLREGVPVEDELREIQAALREEPEEER
jgi:hypothetical protein